MVLGALAHAGGCVLASQGACFESCSKPPFNQPIINLVDMAARYMEEGDHSHEAGYDAFITGVVFLRVSSRRGSRRPLCCGTQLQ